MIAIPPSSAEAESGALGCILLDPAEVIPKARQLLPGPSVFFDQSRQHIYRTILRMYEAGQGIDVVTLSHELGSKLADVGGLSLLTSLQDQTPSAINFPYYAEILVEKHRQREIQARALEILKMIDADQKPQLIMARWSDSAVELSGAAPARSIKELSKEAYDDIMAAADRVREGRTIGLNIGIRTFDQRTKGLNPKELVVIAARPSVGKTSCLLTIARNIALTSGPVAYISFESDTDELTKRLIGIEAHLDFQHPEEWTDDDYRNLTTATTTIGKLPIHMECLPETSIDQICALAIGLNHRHKLKALFLDSLGMIPGTRNHYQDKERVNEVIAYLCRLKRKLGIPVIVSHHLNREVEEGRRPQLKNLSQSGEVEKYADIVTFLHQPGTDDKRIHMPAITATMILAKRRGGATGDCEAEFLRYCGRWQDLPLDPAAK